MNNKDLRTKGKKKPWPTKDVMKQIYEQQLWGGKGHDFYSGEGSHKKDLVQPYVKVVGTFLRSLNQPPVVCDLGCGDFNVGKELVKLSDKYVGIDIVESLIERNKNQFKADNLEFMCLDIAKDDLPEGDCALVRHVLQHLSNDEIKRILPKLINFRYVIVTEHLPEGDFIPNKDIISGQGIRFKKQSGIDLLAPPFCLEAEEVKNLLTVPYEKGNGVIVTTLFKINGT